jgi:hypothetical protein
MERLLLPSGSGEAPVLQGARDDRPVIPIPGQETARLRDTPDLSKEGRGDFLVPLRRLLGAGGSRRRWIRTGRHANRPHRSATIPAAIPAPATARERRCLQAAWRNGQPGASTWDTDPSPTLRVLLGRRAHGRAAQRARSAGRETAYAARPSRGHRCAGPMFMAGMDTGREEGKRRSSPCLKAGSPPRKILPMKVLEADGLR